MPESNNLEKTQVLKAVFWYCAVVAVSVTFLLVSIGVINLSQK